MVSRPVVLLAGPPRPRVISQKSRGFSRPESACPRRGGRLPRRFPYQEDGGSHFRFGTTEARLWPVVPSLLPEGPAAHISPGTEASVRLWTGRRCWPRQMALGVLRLAALCLVQPSFQHSGQNPAQGAWKVSQGLRLGWQPSCVSQGSHVGDKRLKARVRRLRERACRNRPGCARRVTLFPVSSLPPVFTDDPPHAEHASVHIHLRTQTQLTPPARSHCDPWGSNGEKGRGRNNCPTTEGFGGRGVRRAGRQPCGTGAMPGGGGVRVEC